MYKYGKVGETDIYISDLDNISINYDTEMIKCEEKYNGNILHIDIIPIKSGKTTINIEGDTISENNQLEKMTIKRKVYIHKSGIVTVGSFIGKCNGDISFIISFTIIVIVILIYLIYTYIKSVKENMYSYYNASLLGLIIYIGAYLLLHLAFIIYDYRLGNNYSLQGLISSFEENIDLILICVFPFAFIITALVMLSNLKLLKMEGKSWRNMLGIILGGSICLLTIVTGLIRAFSNSNLGMDIISDYIYYLIFMYITYHECIFLSASILGLKAAKHVPKFDKDAIIILGCQTRSDGTLTTLLKSRVDRAIEFSKMQKKSTGKDIIFVPSGGKGNDEIMSEAQSIKNYLIENEINEQSILIEDKAVNTYENIKFSNIIINDKIKNPKIAFSTTNYHVLRTGIIATKQGIDIEGIGAKTKAYYWINAFIREFVATLVSEKKSHIKVLAGMALVLFVFMFIRFISFML